MLVVVADRVGPFAEPAAKRLDEQLTGKRMAAQLLPLVVGRTAGPIEDLGVDLELPDVVEKRRPVEPIEVVLGEADLAAEARGVPTHALGVTAGDAVVHVERGHAAEGGSAAC